MDEIQGKLATMQVDHRRGSSSSQARADAVVAQYLERYHASSPAAMALCKELTATGGDVGQVPDLLDLLAHYDAQASSSNLATVSDAKSQATLLPPSLPTGLYTYRITATHSSLHPSNILLLRSVILPTRRFDTSLPSPDFVTTHTPCLLTSGADKRLLFSSAETGEVFDALEPAARPGSGEGHTAPVLDVAQHPLFARELVAVGMDGTVVLWDLLLRKAVQVRAKDHARFVVRCVWSEDGEWLATAGYDKRINVYRRIAGDGNDMDEDEEDEIEVQPLKTMLELCQTINTKGNPEAIVFLPDGAQPPAKEPSSSPQLPWLVWTQRDDCHINYDRVAGPNTATRSLRYNINPTPLDTHVSYSLLSLSIHPTLPLLCLVTGSHATEGAPTQILLLPFFAGGSDQERVATIHTTVPSSASYVPRQAWFSRAAGEGVWLASEHGRLKLYDLASGEEKVDVGVHGAASEDNNGEGMGMGMGAEEKARRWRLGTMNGVIKDVITLEDGRVATCGFDRTVRILKRID